MSYYHNNANNKFTCKIVILGDAGVGKTCIMNRYDTKQFSGQYKATIGADFITKDVVVTDPIGMSHVATLQIWDTAGQERFQSLGVGFYRGATGAILVYDITDPLSLSHLTHWKNEFLQQVQPQADVMLHDNVIFPFIVVGNKYDKDKKGRKIPHHRALEWCRENHIGYQHHDDYEQSDHQLLHYETSAKTGWNVDEVFNKIASLSYQYEQYKRTQQQQIHYHHYSDTTMPPYSPPYHPSPANQQQQQYIDFNRQYSTDSNYSNTRNPHNSCC